MRKPMSAAFIALLAGCGPATQQTPTPSTPPVAAVRSAEENQVALAALPAPYNTANYEAGRRVFAQCRSCHTINAGGPNRVGPNLHGVFGREIGSLEGFAYSQSVQDANFVWDAGQLDHWLQSPQSFLPGNRMAFAGVRSEQQRRDLIAYLMVETTE